MSVLLTTGSRVRARSVQSRAWTQNPSSRARQNGRAHGLEYVRARTPHTPRVCVNALAGVSKRARIDSRALTRGGSRRICRFGGGDGSSPARERTRGPREQQPTGTAAKGDRLSFGCPVRFRGSPGPYHITVHSLSNLRPFSVQFQAQPTGRDVRPCRGRPRLGHRSQRPKPRPHGPTSPNGGKMCVSAAWTRWNGATTSPCAPACQQTGRGPRM